MGVSAKGLRAVALGWILLAGVTVPAISVQIEGIAVTSADGRLEFHIEGIGESTDAVPVDAFVLTDPDRLIVDIPGLLEPVAPDVGENLPEGLAGIRWATYREEPDVPVSRYVLELSEPAASVEVTREGLGTTVCAVQREGAEQMADGQAPPESEGEKAPAQAESVANDFASAAPPVIDEAPEPPVFNEAPESPVAEEAPETAMADETPESPVAEESPESQVADKAPDAPAADEMSGSPLPSEAPVAPVAGQESEAPVMNGATEASAAAPETSETPAAGEASQLALADEASDPSTAGTATEASPVRQEPAGKVPALSMASDVAPEPAPVDAAPPVPAVPEWAQQWADDTRAMSLDVQGASVHAVLRSIAEFADVNIVADRDVSGEVIVSVGELPWPKVLEAVCLSQGLRALPGDGVIRVATLRTVQNEEIELEAAARRREDLMPLSTRVLPVSYAKAEELQESLTFLLSNRGSMNYDERTNSLLVTDIQPRVAALEGMVRNLDTETVQVQIRAKLVDADATAIREIGINWDLQNLTRDGVTGGVTVDLDDVLSPAIEARVGVVDNFGQLDALLQLLEDHNKAEIISNPSITTVSNREASILVGKEVPLIVLDEAGNPTTELKKVGITLRVTPVVNDNGRVTLDMHPEVSDLSSQATVQGGVVFTTTEADTRVMVASGQTAVIGGLIREATIEFERGVPILMHIPFFGNLFKRTSDRKEMRELFIFVTPTILDGVAQLSPESEENIR